MSGYRGFHACVICGYGCVWPAHTCSELCRDTARIEKLRKKYRRRRLNPEYRRKKKARQLAKRRAKRQADPAWQAWRAAVDERKRLAAARASETRNCIVCGRDITDLNYHRTTCSSLCRKIRKQAQEGKIYRTGPPNARTFGLQFGTSEWTEYQTERERRNRIRRNLKPHYRENEQARHRRAREKEMAPILALRELGWVRGYDVIVNPEKQQTHKLHAKYLAVIRAYSDRYRTGDRKTKHLLSTQISAVFAINRSVVDAALRDRSRRIARALDGVCIIVDRQGVATITRVEQDSDGGRPKKRYPDRRSDLRRKALLAALTEMGWLRDGQVVPPQASAPPV